MANKKSCICNVNKENLFEYFSDSPSYFLLQHVAQPDIGLLVDKSDTNCVSTPPSSILMLALDPYFGQCSSHPGHFNVTLMGPNLRCSSVYVKAYKDIPTYDNETTTICKTQYVQYTPCDIISTPDNNRCTYTCSCIANCSFVHVWPSSNNLCELYIN